MGLRPVRSIGIFKLGVWVDVLASTAFVRRTVPSRGDEASDELALVAALDGIELKSRATRFKGGTMTAWFGGIALDLREAELAPGARLSVNALFGGIAIRIPSTWRIESDVKSIAGGVDVKTGDDPGPDAPVLTIDGMTLFGGIAVGAKDSPVAGAFEEEILQSSP